MLISDNNYFFRSVEHHTCLLTLTIQTFNNYDQILNEHYKRISFRITPTTINVTTCNLWMPTKRLDIVLAKFYCDYQRCTIFLIICIWTEVYRKLIICNLKSSQCILSVPHIIIIVCSGLLWFCDNNCFICTLHAEMTFLSNRISDYYYISQGKTRIYGVNDGEEFQITDVSDWRRCFT